MYRGSVQGVVRTFRSATLSTAWQIKKAPEGLHIAGQHPSHYPVLQALQSAMCHFAFAPEYTPWACL